MVSIFLRREVRLSDQDMEGPVRASQEVVQQSQWGMEERELTWDTQNDRNDRRARWRPNWDEDQESAQGKKSWVRVTPRIQMGRTWERMAGGGEEVSPRLLRLLSWGILCHSTNYTHGERRWEQIEGHFRAGHLETAALTPSRCPHLLISS